MSIDNNKNQSPEEVGESKTVFELLPSLVAPLSDIYSSFRKKIDATRQLDDLISTIRSICDSDPNAALAAIHLQKVEPPLVQSIHGAVLCHLVAERLQFDEATHRSTLRAMLTANIALVVLQALLNNYENPLSEDQIKRIRKHPQEACSILEEAGVDDRQWLDIIAQHHERPDGQGYPKGLKSGEILGEALLVANAEFYIAMIDKRAYRSKKNSQEALRELYANACPNEKRIQTGFIKEVGIYPPGSYVKLASGEIALVWKRNGESLMPYAKALFDPKGKHYMSGLTRDCSKANFKIISHASPPKPPTVDILMLWQN